MAEKPEPLRQREQHNHGPGIFIAGHVLGDVHHYAPSPQEGHPPDLPPKGAGARTDGRASDAQETAGGRGAAYGPFGSLMGCSFAALLLFAAAGVGAADTFAARTPTADRVLSVPVAAGLAIGGLVPLAFALAALAEVCAAGAGNAAGAAVARGEAGRAGAARLNLRHARLLARTADRSAVLAGYAAALVGFLAVGRRAADRAQEASDAAVKELEKAEAAWRSSVT
ncbi:hypothetical protein AB0C13_10915 [Streptomyces sp. NPDC049099]|uniref:hypothetical protein n=1 Tax=Streptomyces sp. NPDC049099 TaxID=3155768 RepID=UPI00344193B8